MANTKFSQFTLQSPTATTFLVGYDGASNVRFPYTGGFGTIVVPDVAGEIIVTGADIEANWDNNYVVTNSTATYVEMSGTDGSYTKDITFYLVNRNLESKLQIFDDDSTYLFYQGSYDIRNKVGQPEFFILPGGVARIRYDSTEEQYYVNGDI